MEWYFAILLMFGLLVILMGTGMPISFAFIFICIIGGYIFWGGEAGLEQLAMSFYSSVTNYNFLPIPLFILMGDIVFTSGSGTRLIDAIDQILGKLPGRLSILAIGSGVLLGTMIGISGGSIGILGKVLVPEMNRRGYSRAMSIGPIVSSGTLAILIPPSALAVFLGAVAQVSIGKLLLAIIVPGLLVAALFIGYIIIRCALNPSLAPNYDIPKVSVSQKIRVIFTQIAPVVLVIFAVIGSVFTGIATPGESAALGVIACYILAALYRKLSWETIMVSAQDTIHVTVMIFFIVVGSITFSRILATTGAISGLISWATGLEVHPVMLVIATQLILIFLGAFMDPASIVMITVPVFFPLVKALGYDTLWFAVISLINIQLGLISPPFGMDCFTMKAIAPADVTLGDVLRSSMPFMLLGFLAMTLVMIFPQIGLFLPDLMQ
ncbi:MAG: TRAP transporter large permease subunit [Deltaproteobacteria bacterium]|nr:TRAP transporter large permease subunit [Deltaproteobacteria bacterium]